IVRPVAASPSGMSQSQIASTRSATAAEGRMLLEKPSGTMCSPPQLGGCNSSCERPIGCTDTTRKAPCWAKAEPALNQPAFFKCDLLHVSRSLDAERGRLHECLLECCKEI